MNFLEIESIDYDAYDELYDDYLLFVNMRMQIVNSLPAHETPLTIKYGTKCECVRTV